MQKKFRMPFVTDTRKNFRGMGIARDRRHFPTHSDISAQNTPKLASISPSLIRKPRKIEFFPTPKK